MLAQFSLATAQRLFVSQEQYPISFDDAWQWLEYSEKRAAKVYLIENLEIEIDYVEIVPLGTLAVPRPAHQISLSIEGFKNWAMMSKTEVGKLVRRYFLECERQLKSRSGMPLDQIARDTQHCKQITELATQALDLV
jgi:phage anti-repressor protein